MNEEDTYFADVQRDQLRTGQLGWRFADLALINAAIATLH